MGVDDTVKLCIPGCDLQVNSIAYMKVELECDFLGSNQTNVEWNSRFRGNKDNLAEIEFLSVHFSAFTGQS